MTSDRTGNYYIGLDIGTSKISAVLVDSRSGRKVFSYSLPNDSVIVYRDKRRRDWSEQEPEKILNICYRLLSRFHTYGYQIEAIGLTCQMHGVMVLNERLKPIHNLITWQDGRANEIMPKQRISYIDFMKKTIDRKERDSTGCSLASGYFGPTIFWLSQQKKLPDRCLPVFIGDYIGSVLTGTKPITDYTNAGSSGIFDIVNKKWFCQSLDRWKIPKRILPDVSESGTMLGQLRRDEAKLLGFSPKVRVCSALGDNQASFLGSAGGKSNLLINLGTGGQVSLAIDKYAHLPGLETRYLPKNRYLIVGASLCGGRAYVWLKDFFEQVGEKIFETTRSDIYEIMNKLAKRNRENTNGLVCGPYFSGTRLKPDKRGYFAGISMDNFTPENLTRALLEGMVSELYDFYKKMQKYDTLNQSRYMIASGNAVRKNKLLVRIMQEIFQRKVQIPPYEEEAAYGAALVAMGHYYET